MLPTLFTGFIQSAYVTNDLAHAKTLMERRYGVSKLAILDMTLDLTDGTTADMRCGLAFVGELQLEFLEPRGGADAIWRAPLSKTSFSLKFHHQGFFLETPVWGKIHELIEAHEQRIVLTASMQSIPLIYTDNRDELGHYMEYAHYTDSVKEILRSIPRN